MPISNRDKMFTGLFSDIIQQQQAFRNKFEINPGLSAAIASMSSMVKVYEKAMPKKDILSAVIGNSSLAYILEAQKQANTFKNLNLSIGITGLAQQISPIQKTYNRNDFKNVISPMLQIQDSLNALYKSNSAFANYNNLFNNHSFVGQMKGLQLAITGISGYMVANAFLAEDNYANEYDLETVLNETSSIAVNIAENKTVTYEEFIALKEKIDAIYNFLITKPKQITLYTIIIFILFKIEPLINDIVQQAQHHFDSIDGITKKDIKELGDKYQLSMYEMGRMLVKQEIRYAQRVCFLKLKYNNKSQSLYKINIGKKVTVLRVMGKWLQVSVIDNSDESEITGWVLKKYFKNQLPRK